MRWIFQNTKVLLTAVLLIFTCSWNGHSQSIPGESLNTRFRIQIQAVGLDEYDKSCEIAGKLSEELNINSYVIQEGRWYKIRIGNFDDNGKAKSKLEIIKKAYPKAWVVTADNDKIKYFSEYLILGNGSSDDHGPQSGDLDSELEIVKQENKESVDSVVDKSANGDNELEDSVTYIGSGSSGYGNKNNGGTSGFFMSNILLFAGGFIVVILLIVLLNRLSVKREKRKIFEEDVKARREWGKLLENDGSK